LNKKCNDLVQAVLALNAIFVLSGDNKLRNFLNKN
jgi:hypothetical protein